MDDIVMRRLKHLQWLEENHAQDFEDRFGPEKTRADLRREEIADALSEDWNRKRKNPEGAEVRAPLPKGWRREHWKTQQSMAADYAGASVSNKDEAIKVLENYEAVLTPRTAA